MSLTSLEKFAHLEDKIRLAVEMCKSLRQEKDALENDLDRALERLAASDAEKGTLEARIGRLKSEREEMKHKVEEMLNAIAALEMEAESLNR
jgi:chromosome segregation ATPase